MEIKIIQITREIFDLITHVLTMIHCRILQLHKRIFAVIAEEEVIVKRKLFEPIGRFPDLVLSIFPFSEYNISLK